MLGAAAGVHGGQLAVEQEAEPAVAAGAELQRGRVAPHVQRVAAAAQRPLRPRVAHAAGQARRVLAAACATHRSLSTPTHSLRLQLTHASTPLTRNIGGFTIRRQESGRSGRETLHFAEDAEACELF